MLHPSYTDLLNVVNQDVEEGATAIVNSRYSIVVATSKRARQIIDGEQPLIYAKATDKPLSVAIEELNSSKIKIIAEEQTEELEQDIFMEEDMEIEELLVEEEISNEEISDEEISEEE